MHNRIHPLFAESFLGALDQLPAGNPLKESKGSPLVTRLEIVLGPGGEGDEQIPLRGRLVWGKRSAEASPSFMLPRLASEAGGARTAACTSDGDRTHTECCRSPR